MKKSSFLIQLAIVTACLSFASASMAQYVWLDDKGNKQFSDQPPPPSVPKKRILKFSGKPMDSQGNSDEVDAPAVAKPSESLADKELAYKKRQAEQEKKNKQAEEQAKAAAVKADNCARMREYKQTLDSGQRIQQTDSNGNRGYMGDSKRAEEIARTNQTLSDCGN